MAKLQSMLEERFKPSATPSSKMVELAQRSAEGHLNSFAGLFALTPMPSDMEQEQLTALLQRYATSAVTELESDVQQLLKITTEVKAINNQAALLHGERIKRAQLLLKQYREGAFTSWLVETYGNRQTPYNFLQYYELHRTIPKELHVQMERMPRQALYTLASREGSLTSKLQIIREYQGQTKQVLLEQIRKDFPLSAQDRRRQRRADVLLFQLQQISQQLQQQKEAFSQQQRRQLQIVLDDLQAWVNTK